MDKCIDCQTAEFFYTLKLIPSGRQSLYPKYLPQIKKSCASCGRYLRFETQTPELIEKINKVLEEIRI